jgi:uncharacterized SAM-binding protein YcdF (DUF218 family)
MRRFRLLVVVLFVAIGLASQAARLLVVDDPQKSDAIVVLAGETDARPARGIELLRQGEAQNLLVDVVASDQIFGQGLSDIAAKYLSEQADAAHMSVCRIEGLSTMAEAADARRCLEPLAPHRILIVTSASHTRRAVAIFRHRLPQYQFSVTAAHDPSHFGMAWWTNREWAKTTFDEWTKLVWWEAVDRWR